MITVFFSLESYTGSRLANTSLFVLHGHRVYIYTFCNKTSSSLFVVDCWYHEHQNLHRCVFMTFEYVARSEMRFSTGTVEDNQRKSNTKPSLERLRRVRQRQFERWPTKRKFTSVKRNGIIIHLKFHRSRTALILQTYSKLVGTFKLKEGERTGKLRGTT